VIVIAGETLIVAPSDFGAVLNLTPISNHLK